MLSSHGDSVFCAGSNFVENQIGALQRRIGRHKAPILLNTTRSCNRTGKNYPPVRASSRMLASKAASKAASPVRPVA